MPKKSKPQKAYRFLVAGSYSFNIKYSSAPKDKNGKYNGSRLQDFFLDEPGMIR